MACYRIARALWLLVNCACVARLRAKPSLAAAMATAGEAGEKLTPIHHAAIQYWNNRLRDWVAAHVQPMAYAVETPLLHNWGSVWQPSHAGNDVSAGDIVLMTHAVPQQLPYFRAGLSLWNAPASIAVYIPYKHTDPRAAACRARVLAYMQNTIALMQRRSGAAGAPALALALLYGIAESPVTHCQLAEGTSGLEGEWVDRELWRRTFQGRPYLAVYDAEYPSGSLWQLAFQLIPDDKLVFQLDVDFLPPADFATALARGNSSRLLSQLREAWVTGRERRAVVVPAFDRVDERRQVATPERCAASVQNATGSACWLFAGVYDMPLTKQELQEAVQAGLVVPSSEKDVSEAHTCYSPRESLHATTAYPILYTHPCEPYFIALKAAMPPFDERWRGRDLQRANYIAHMAVWGTKFNVDPEGFIVRLPVQPAADLLQAQPQGAMKFHSYYAKEIPFSLTRLFFSDISFQTQANLSFLPAPWTPHLMLSNAQQAELQQMLADDRRRLRPPYPVSPWLPGLSYCIRSSSMGRPGHAGGAVPSEMRFNGRWGCLAEVHRRQAQLQLRSPSGVERIDRRGTPGAGKAARPALPQLKTLPQSKLPLESRAVLVMCLVMPSVLIYVLFTTRRRVHVATGGIQGLGSRPMVGTAALAEHQRILGSLS